MVDEVIASLKIEGLTVDDYCKSQLDEYIAGRMTRKMMLQMMDEYYLSAVDERNINIKKGRVNNGI